MKDLSALQVKAVLALVSPRDVAGRTRRRMAVEVREQIRQRLSRAGNRRMNHVLHIAAIVQLRHDTPGRANFLRKVAAGGAIDRNDEHRNVVDLVLVR